MRDITGQKFGRLTALRPTEERKNGQVVWLCKCDCGRTSRVRVRALTTGTTQSCGCWRSYALRHRMTERNKIR